jgi:hypothetical protein
MKAAVLGNGSFAAHSNFLKLFSSRFDHILVNYNASKFCKTLCGAFTKHTFKYRFILGDCLAFRLYSLDLWFLH